MRSSKKENIQHWQDKTIVVQQSGFCRSRVLAPYSTKLWRIQVHQSRKRVLDRIDKYENALALERTCMRAVDLLGMKIVYAPAIERMLKSAQSTDTSVNRLPDAMHDLLLGQEEPQISKEIIAWVTAHS